MSLLDNGPDVVTLYADTETTTDGYGNVIVVPDTDGAGVSIRGRWQPSTADEDASLGQESTTICRFLCREFPSGPWGRVAFDGDNWDVVGEPREHRGSWATRHVTVYLRKR